MAFWINPNLTFVAGVILLFLIASLTLMMTFIYDKGFYFLFFIYVESPSFFMLFPFTFYYMKENLHAHCITLDYPTALLVFWNFGAVGMIVIHFQGPLRLQKAYVITTTAFMALVFLKFVPEYTIWVLMISLSAWDTFAVLSPEGPLKNFVDIAHERNEQIVPALIYSSNILYLVEINMGERGEPNRAGRGSNDNFNNGEQTPVNSTL